MLKKIKLFGAAAALAVAVSSCTTINHSAVVTNNPVGSKTGISKSGPFSKTQGVSYVNSMKDGGISKIGIAEYKAKTFFFVWQKLTVTGE